MPDISSIFIDHVSIKQDRLRRVMWKWTPAARGPDLNDAVRRAAVNVLLLYPGLTNHVPEKIEEIVEYVGRSIKHTIGQVEVMLNHSPPCDDNPHNYMNYLCAEVRHEATKVLLRRLVSELAEVDQDSILPGQPK